MNFDLLIVGLLKALFGVFVGAAGIFVAARTLHRWLGSGEIERSQQEGNVALGILKAGSLIALGMLLQHAVISTFTAMDLMYRNADISLLAARRIATYALLHVAVSVVAAAGVLALGTFLFTRLTRGVDEMAEIRRGNVAPAVVLAAVMVVLALMTSPGLEMMLEGLIPLPVLGRDEVLAPS